MAFNWSSLFRQFNTKVHRKNIASIIKLDIMIELVSPAPNAAWQEPIELAYAFMFLGSEEIDNIMGPIRQGFLANFRSEGDQVGGWKQLADWTMEERAQLLREVEHYTGGTSAGLVPGFSAAYPILQRTGEYMRSWVNSDHPDHGREISSLGNAGRLILEGSDDPRAEELSTGNPARNLEARPVAPVGAMYETAMKARIDAMLTKYIQNVKPPR